MRQVVLIFYFYIFVQIIEQPYLFLKIATLKLFLSLKQEILSSFQEYKEYQKSRFHKLFVKFLIKGRLLIEWQLNRRLKAETLNFCQQKDNLKPILLFYWHIGLLKSKKIQKTLKK